MSLAAEALRSRLVTAAVIDGCVITTFLEVHNLDRISAAVGVVAVRIALIGLIFYSLVLAVTGGAAGARLMGIRLVRPPQVRLPRIVAGLVCLIAPISVAFGVDMAAIEIMVFPLWWSALLHNQPLLSVVLRSISILSPASVPLAAWIVLRSRLYGSWLRWQGASVTLRHPARPA
jgi:hypothetical protein